MRLLRFAAPLLGWLLAVLALAVPLIHCLSLGTALTLAVALPSCFMLALFLSGPGVDTAGIGPDDAEDEPTDPRGESPDGRASLRVGLLLGPGLLLSPLPAHAAAVGQVVAPSFFAATGAAILAFLATHVAESVLVALIGALGVYLAPGLQRGWSLLKTWLVAHIHSAVLREFTTRAGDLVETFVEQQGATFVDAAKAAAKDGKLPRDVGMDAALAVFNSAKTGLGPLWVALSAIIGELGATNILKGIIEEVVSLRNKAPPTPAEANAKIIGTAKHLDMANAAAALADKLPAGPAQDAALATAATLAKAAQISSAQVVTALSGGTP